MKTELIQFIDKLKDDKNSLFLESIKKITTVILESYADVCDVTEPSIDKFQNFAASINPTMRFIKQSSESLRNRFVFDDEPELDFNDTSMFNQSFYDSPTIKAYDEIEDSLGLTATDLYQRQHPDNIESELDDAFDLSNFDPDSF